ncbi:CarboxypepD_reg-like domain-containing protein [Tenacibaculum sp. MAR_2009_124]|uniref:outer membrane beta-barrel protein n=1 Tax=Tenacibaculum sp. MAR_2009_124 TaxID=1250059 RepID=UPI000896287B|nr:outer membrane beta-barrel protein [Tenacibaculum sp. MAR_2009_124]SED17263.1 CarboxypepD_reg-like domain-containing protein [Tenacibaculum sp. MAR_2009_124]
MKKLIIAIAMFTSAITFAQSFPFNISGTIQTETDKKIVESATVYLERIKDSSVVSYTISNDKGNFELEGKSFYKDLKLIVSFVGMKNFSKTLDLSKNASHNLGSINLTEDNLLSEVIVKSSAPITIKKDTLEFNVKSFKTKKDANVEDLLKKLPGVDVDEEGKITVNGKTVNKVLVNGKPFFGNDPTITTKNLSKEIIEKIQVTDTKTKSEAFSGEKGDGDNKTINLTIKKENNKGWFGRVSAGAGTDERYEGATMVNRFDNDQRISVLASTNNINSPGFSFGEIRKMFGGGGNIWVNGNGSFNVNGRSFGGGSGIIKSKTAGMTYADTYKKGLDVNLNYFYSGSSSNNDSKNNRENILPDSRYFSNNSSSSFDENDNHSVNAEFDIEIDSTFLINVSPKFVLNDRSGTYQSTEETYDENRVLTNQSDINSRSSSTAKNFQNDIDITKRIGKNGSFIKTSITNQIDKSDTDDYVISSAETFGTSPSIIERNQFSDQRNNLTSLRTRMSYRYAIVSKKLFFDVKYNYRSYERENIKSTFDLNTSNGQYDLFNTELSSNFTSNDISKTPTAGVAYKSKKFRFNINTGVLNRNLKNEDELRPELNFQKDFNSFIFNSDFRYRFDSKARIYLSYNLDSDAPSIRQLNPFSDVSNPLNIVTGNPFLKPTERHRMYLSFNKFNWQKRTGFYLYFGGSLVNNQVVSKSVVDSNFKRTTTFENVDGFYNIWGGANYNKKIKIDTITTINIRTGLNLSGNRNINFFNDVQYKSTTTSISPNIGFTLEWNKVFMIEPRYTVNLSKTTFDLDNFTNQNFTRHNLNIRSRANFFKKLEWNNDVRYSYNPDVIGFNKSAWFWNSVLSYSVLKDKGSISLKAYDLLNQNNNVRRRATQNYIEDSESTVLQQYLMLGFSWKFNSLGKKGNIRDHNFRF